MENQRYEPTKPNQQKPPMKSILFAIWRSIYPILIYLGWSFAVSFAMTMIGTAFLMARSGGSINPEQLNNEVLDFIYAHMLEATIACQILTLPFVIWFYHRDIIKHSIMRTDKPMPAVILSASGMRKPSIGAMHIAVICLISISCCISLNSLITYSHLHELFPSFDNMASSLYGTGIVLQVVAMVILAPIVEEMLCRILSYHRLQEAFPPKRDGGAPLTAMLLSSLFFGLMHMNMVQGIYAFGIGMCFVLLYEWTHRIWVPMLAHGIANAMSVIISNTSDDTIFNLPQTGEYILVAVCTVILAGLLGFVIWRMLHRSTGPQPGNAPA